MDCTSSMEPWIQAAKDQIRDILQSFPHTNFQVAFVGYRDYGDEEPVVTIDFTNVDSLLEKIRDVHAIGGDDIAEDVYTGMNVMMGLDWTGCDIQCVFHIADAPPHGADFHSIWVSDNHINTPMYPITELLESMAQKKIDYTFIRINDSTDIMLERFHRAYKGPGNFKVVDLVEQGRSLTPPRIRRRVTDSLTPAITRTIEDSITRYTCSQDPTSL